MGAKIHHDRLIRQMKDDELEKFVRAWSEKKGGFFRVVSFPGAGDRGRDVVGYLSDELDAGDWHNFQCKQYGKNLGTAEGFLELGKVLYFSHLGEFTAPVRFFYVAPKGLNKNLRDFIANPVKFKAEMLAKWDDYCAKKIIDKQTLPLTPELRAFVESYDFARVEQITVDMMLADSAAKSVLFKWFGEDPGPAPGGVVPPAILGSEMLYVSALLEAYGERDDCTYADYAAIAAHAVHGAHFIDQRERYFDADAFTRFYRDNTSEEEIARLRKEIRHGVIDEHRADHADSLRRVDAVMLQAARIHPGGVLGRHAGIPVKQGICHHFVNDGEMKWKK